MADEKMSGRQLRAIRLRLNMTQQDFGEAMMYAKGGARQRVWELEQGLKRIVPVRLMIVRNLEKEWAVRPPRSVRLATRREFQ